MNTSMSIDYPIFTYNNESVILKPGNQFTSRELKSRLHQMDIDARDIQSRNNLINLYESTLRDDQNKFKLFDRLKKDTEMYSSKMGLSLKQTVPMPSRKENINPEKSKVINLVYGENTHSYEEKPYEEKNKRLQEIKLKRPQYYTYNNMTNPFFTNANYKQNNDNTYNEVEEAEGEGEGEEEEEEIINNDINDKYNKYNKNSGNFQNNESGYHDLEHTNNYNNYYRNNNVNINYRNPNIDNNDRKIYSNTPDNYTPNTDLQKPYHKIRNAKNIYNSENINIKEPDEESTISFFSSFSSFKNSKQICIHVLTGFIIICLAFGLLYLYRIFSESINDFFSNVFEILTHPGQIISSTFGYIIDYWYIIPIILIFLIIFISLWKRYELKKRCKEIIKKIEEDLSKESEDYRISEDDIYIKYVQGYGISVEKFRKKYLPILRKMRRNNRRLKNSSEKIGGKEIIFWHIINNQ